MVDTVTLAGDAVFGGLLTVGGWFLKLIRDDHKELKEDHGKLRDDFSDLSNAMPNTYARRDDVKDALMELRQQHQRIDAKLDRLLSRQ